MQTPRAVDLLIKKNRSGFSVLGSPGSHYMLKPCGSSQHGFNSRAAFNKTNNSWTSFVDDVKRCFRRSSETAKTRSGDHLANPFFA